MKLLLITRKVDKSDTRTGFIFDWIKSLANKLDMLYVVCQEKGDVLGLGDNVEIHSFGKEKGYGRLRQLLTVNYLLLTLGRKVDGIFCHMMPIYAIIAWLPAKLQRKKIILWYTHKSVDIKLRVATMLVDRILTASKKSFRLESNKVKVVGHGIPVGKFQIPNSKFQINPKFQIKSIGRISRVKDYETLIKAVEILVNHKGVKDVRCEIYGDPALKEDLVYLQSLREFVKNSGLKDYIDFQGGTAYDQVPEIYAQADLFINLSKTGSLDKAVLEAAASKTMVMSSNEAFESNLKGVHQALFFKRNNPEDLADQIEKIKNLAEGERNRIVDKLFQWVSSKHNLENLTVKILAEFM